MNAPSPVQHPIPPGAYRAKGIVSTAQLGTSQTGTEQAAIEVMLLDLGKTVTSILFFTDKTTEQSIERLKLLGWKGGNDWSGIDQNEVTVLVSYEDYNGAQQMKVEIQTARFVFKSPMGEPEKRSFFSRLNDLAARGKAPAAGAGGGYPADWDKPGPAAPAGGAQPKLEL